MAGKREQRKETIRKAIIKATAEAFFEKGYKKTSLDEITKRAGVTKRTLYKYFPSKVTLYCDMVDHYIQGLNSRLSKTLTLNLSTDKKLLRLVDDLISFSRENEEFMHIFITFDVHQFEGMPPSELVDRVNLLRQTMIKDIAEVVRKGQEQGVVIDHDPELLVHLVLAVCKGIYSHANLETNLLNTDVSLDALFETLFTILNKDVIKQTRKGLILRHVKS
jgi:AcrR family transcriptional regulator